MGAATLVTVLDSFVGKADGLAGAVPACGSAEGMELWAPFGGICWISSPGICCHACMRKSTCILCHLTVFCESLTCGADGAFLL